MQYTIDELKTQSIKALKAIWAQVFAKPAPPFARKDFLMNNLHYHQHRHRKGQLSQKTRKKLQQLYHEFQQNPDFQPSGSNTRLKAGTRLVREWQGTVHTVTITQQGFEYLDTHYKSLSAIARLITGTQWSGPAFFGLNGGAKA
tara:strand:+ start:1020 stop:1451 length:432 start_codon:yes stop_codon:yes gene_type:complete